LLAALVAGIVLYARSFPVLNENWSVTRDSGANRLVFLALILGAAWLVNRASAARTIGLAGAVMVLLIAVDALTHTPEQNPTVPAAVFGPLGIEETVKARPGVSRALVHPKLQTFLYHAATPDALSYYLGLRRALFLNCNLLDEIPTGSGFFSLELRSAAQVASLLNSDNIPFPEPLADFAGGSQISSSDTSFTWTDRTNFMPLVSAGQQPVFASHAEILRNVGSLDFNPRTTVYLPIEAREFVRASSNAAANIGELRISAERTEFNVEAKAPAVVVVAQAFYVPWHAYVDGARVRLLEANGAFQALEVPAGRHDVKLIYEDDAFKYGLFISLASLLVVAWLGFGKVSLIRI
jgi:hypothetical protein